MEMTKEQAIKDLITLRSKFQHVHKYYPLSDKELTKDNFNEIVEDLIIFLTVKLK